jgi:hypothetical protein
MKAFTFSASVVVAAVCMCAHSAHAVTFTQPVMMETAEGVKIDSSATNIAIGNAANGVGAGNAVGHMANGSWFGMGIGREANGYCYGAGLGWLANGSDFGAGIGYRANGGNAGAAVGYQANGQSEGAALGDAANGHLYGAAMGFGANGYCYGAALGRGANGGANGLAVGSQANGYSEGAALGDAANGQGNGVATGYSANGQGNGAAAGHSANGECYGAAIGYQANGSSSGAALGYGANGSGHCVALGSGADTGGGSSTNIRIAIGPSVHNYVDNSCRIRGELYLDGGDGGFYYRPTFNSGSFAWKEFVIDHPLDPQNKLLRHACLEGPKVQNVYNGTVVLNDKGEAVITLPDYFEALNKAPQYQLTAVGASMPGLYVKQKIENNRFTIAGGVANAEVCWEVKGERNDRAVRENPFVAEERKAVEGMVYGAR